MGQECILNILNGQAMYDFFMQHRVKADNFYTPFNEAMCVGKASPDIFSSRFNQDRCDALNITIEHYTELVLNPLHFFHRCT
jgi:hypothetical protein